MKKIVLSFIMFHSLMHAAIPEKPIVIIVASYNNAHYYKQNLDSIFAQEYSNYRVIYIDDNSCDGTGDLVQQYLYQHPECSHVQLIRNHQRHGLLFNHYHAIHSCNPHEIAVILDGDDWFYGSQVLSRINREYADPDVWLTYGQFMYLSCHYLGCCQELPFEPHEIRSHYAWYTSHVRTFYAGLFHQIDKQDLLDTDNQFYSMAGDLACMIPMIEMAGNHIRFIPEVLYAYNDMNPINDHAVNRQKQIALDNAIRQKNVYPLKPSYYQSNLYVQGMFR